MIFQDFCFFSCSRFESMIEKDFFPFFFFSFFSPRQRKTRRTARVNSSVQQAFNQRAWKILFTRSRTPHRSPLYVPICLFTPAHAAPLHTRPTFRDRLLDFERRELIFLSPFFLFDSIEISNLCAFDRFSNRTDFDKDYWFDRWSENLFRNSRILERGEKESFLSIDSGMFFLLQIKFDKIFEILSKFSSERDVIKTLLILRS